MRMLCMPSDDSGQDWHQKSLELEQIAPQLGLELAEEATYLIFDRAPGAVMAGEGHCLVGRSMIGPKIRPPGPYQLIDWQAAEVHLVEIPFNSTWNEALSAAQTTWENLHRANLAVGPKFYLRLRRGLSDGLKLGIDGLFHV
jgi:hypothetical protein